MEPIKNYFDRTKYYAATGAGVGFLAGLAMRKRVLALTAFGLGAGMAVSYYRGDVANEIEYAKHKAS